MSAYRINQSEICFNNYREGSQLNSLNFKDIPGQPVLKRALEISAAGKHDILIFGPPGSGKKRAVRASSGICAEPHNRNQHVIKANVCPCGLLGLDDRVCICSTYDLKRHWKNICGIAHNYIDMRVPVKRLDPSYLQAGKRESSESIRKRVEAALVIQEERFADESFSCNAGIPSGAVKKYCKIDDDTRVLITETAGKLSLSSKACHSVAKIARTIADLDGCRNIERDHFLEAFYYRRYGDRDIFWYEL